MTFNKKIINLLFIILVTSCSAPKDTDELLSEAQSFILNEDPRSAIIVLKNIIKTEPQNGKARYMLGKAYLLQGDTSSSMKELNKALQFNYQSDELALLLAKNNLNMGNFERSLELLTNKEFTTEKNKISSFMILGQAEIALDNLTKANKNLARAKSINSEAPETLLLQALILSYKEQDDEALVILDSLTKNKAAPHKIWLLKGSIESKHHNFEGAANSFLEFSKLNPSNFNAKTLAAHNLIRAGLYDQAQEIINTLLQLTSQHPTVNLLAAQLAFVAKNYDVAKTHSNNVLMATNNGLAQIISGLSDYKLGNNEQAYYQLNALADDLPSFHKVHKVLAVLQLKLGYTNELTSALENINGEDSSELIAEIGLNLAQQGDIRGANSLLERAIKISPTNAKARANNGLLKILNSDLTGLVDLEQAIKLSPELKEANVALAMTYLKNGDISKAIKVSEAWLSKQPNDVNALLLRGNIALKESKLGIAKQYFNKAALADPLNVTPLYNIAVIFTNEGNDKKSIETLEALLAIDKEYPKAYRLLITNAIRLNEEEELIGKLLDMTQKSPEAIWPRIVLSRRFNNTKQYQKANNILEDITDIDSLPDAYFSTLSNNYVTQRKFTKIDNLFSKWQSAEPDNQRTYSMYIELLDLQQQDKKALIATQAGLSRKALKADFQLRALESYFLLKTNQIEQAEEKVNSLIKIKPTDGFLLRIQGQIHLAKGKYKEAIKYLSTSLKKKQNTYTALYIATAYKQHGDIGSAIQFMESELEKYPHNIFYQKFLAKMYITEHPEKAIKIYSTIIDKNKKDIIALNNLAWIFYEKGQLNKALEYAIKSTNAAPNHPGILDTLGVIQLKMNDIDKAFKTLSLAYEISPNDTEIRIHLAQVEQTRKNHNNVQKLLTNLTEKEREEWSEELKTLLQKQEK